MGGLAPLKMCGRRGGGRRSPPRGSVWSEEHFLGGLRQHGRLKEASCARHVRRAAGREGKSKLRAAVALVWHPSQFFMANRSVSSFVIFFKESVPIGYQNGVSASAKRKAKES